MNAKISEAQVVPGRDNTPQSRPGQASLEDDSDISLRDVFVRIWRGKWTLMVTAAIVVGTVVLWMKLSTPRYTATMVLAPASESGAGGLSSKLSQYSGLAALAGIDLASGETVRPFTQFTEIVTSPLVAERLQAKHGILAKVFATKWAWNGETRKWRRKGHLLTSVTNLMRRFFDLPPVSPPTPLALSEFLEKEVVTSSVARSAMIKLEFEHRDPQFALALLGWLHQEGDAIIREEAEARTSHQIAYIERKLRTTTAADHRRSLIQLLLDQERQMMMIQVDLPFAARVIQPATVSDDPTFPRPLLVIAISLIAGVMLGMFMVFFIDAVRGGRRGGPAMRRGAGKRPKDQASKPAGKKPLTESAPHDLPDRASHSVDTARAAE